VLCFLLLFFVLKLKFSRSGWHLFQWYSVNVRCLLFFICGFWSFLNGGGARTLHEMKQWYDSRSSLVTAVSCFRPISFCCHLSFCRNILWHEYRSFTSSNTETMIHQNMYILSSVYSIVHCYYNLHLLQHLI